MIDTEKLRKMCRLYNRNVKCDGCPLGKRTLRCNVNLASSEDMKAVEKIIDEWQPPTNEKRFIEVFGEGAFKRLVRSEEFARWAAES